MAQVKKYVPKSSKKTVDYVRDVNDPNIKREYKKMAKKTILTDLYDKNLSGLKRAVDFDFWEDEKAFSEKAKFIPGCFYIFQHDSEILYTEDDKEFHDVNPIFLAISLGLDKETNRPYVFGINFNILTVPMRAAFLQELYNLDKQFFDTQIKIDHRKNEHTYSKVIFDTFAINGGVKFCEYVCKKYKINKDSVAFRRYYFENIFKLRLIDYWQWKYLPFLDFSQGIRGVNLAKIQKELINK